MLSSLERCSLAALMEDILTPPIDQIGALNTLLASPTLARWRQGATLDVSEWVAKKNGRTPIVIVSVAHLDDEERALVLGVLLEEILSRSGPCC